MKNLIVLFIFVLFSSSLLANDAQTVEVQLVLNTKVYAESDFRSEALTYIEKGEKVTIIDYSKGFFTIRYNDQTGYITESNIKICEEFQKFKYELFSRKNDKEKNENSVQSI